MESRRHPRKLELFRTERKVLTAACGGDRKATGRHPSVEGQRKATEMAVQSASFSLKSEGRLRRLLWVIGPALV